MCSSAPVKVKAPLPCLIICGKASPPASSVCLLVSYLVCLNTTDKYVKYCKSFKFYVI